MTFRSVPACFRENQGTGAQRLAPILSMGRIRQIRGPDFGGDVTGTLPVPEGQRTGWLKDGGPEGAEPEPIPRIKI